MRQLIPSATVRGAPVTRPGIRISLLLLLGEMILKAEIPGLPSKMREPERRRRIAAWDLVALKVGGSRTEIEIVHDVNR